MGLLSPFFKCQQNDRLIDASLHAKKSVIFRYRTNSAG